MVRSELISQYLTLTGSLRLNGSTSGHIDLISPSAPTSYTITLPTNAGTSGYVLSTNGSGVTSWVSNSTTPTGDPNTMAFFNGAGNLSDQVDFTWDALDLVVPGNINPSVNDAYGLGNPTNEWASLYVNTVFSNMDLNLEALAGDLLGQGNGVSMLANTGNITLTSTVGSINIAATSASGNIGISTTSGQVYIQGDTIILSDAAGANQITVNGTTLTPTAGLLVLTGKLEITDRLQLDGATSGAVNLLASAVTTPYTLTLPPNAGIIDYALTTDGSGVTSWSPVASSTWQSTIAYSTNSYSSDGVNAPADAISFLSGMPGQTHYLATDDNDGTVGDGTPTPLGIIAGSYTGTGTFTSITGGELDLLAGANHQTGASIGQVTGGNLNLYAGTAVGSGDGGQITINGGNATHGGNGNGGPILIETGIPCGTGERGSMTLTSSVTQMNSPVMILSTATSDAAAGAQAWLYYNTVTNQVRIHDATVWKDFGTTGANTALSNLTNPTAVNQILNDTNGLNSLDLTNRVLYDSSELFSISYDTRSLIDSAGNQAMDFQNRLLTYSSGQASVDYANSTLFDAANLQALNYEIRVLSYSTGGVSVDWQNSTLFDTYNMTALNWNSRALVDFTGFASIYWESRTLSDSSGNDSLKYADRTLIDPSGGISLDWSVPGTVSFNSTVIKSPAGGSGTIPTLTTTYNVTDARVTTGSQVIVTLQTAAVAVVQSVVPAAGNFNINLTASVVATLNFKYTIIESPA